MSYFESRLKVDFIKFEEIKKTIHFCQELGIKNLILEPKNQIYTIDSNFKLQIANLSSINTFYRITIYPSNIDDLKKKLRNFNKSTDILCVETSNKEIQLQAAKDSRVDLISYSEEGNLKTLNPGVISLARQNNSFIEFSLAPLMVNNKSSQSKFLRNLYRGIHMAINLDANIIISGNFVNNYDLRNPRALVSTCTTLLDLSINKAKKYFSEQVKQLLDRVKNRNNRNILESGVKIINEDY